MFINSSYISELTEDDHHLIALAACSLNKSPRVNWVEKYHAIDNYLCTVIKGIMRSGRPLESAIAIGISRMRAWASGRGEVKADTRAKAAKSIATWDKARAKAKADDAKLSNTDEYEIMRNNLATVEDIDGFDNLWLLAARFEDCSQGFDGPKEVIKLAVLTTRGRKRLSREDFAIWEDGKGRYPIYDRKHALNALTRVSQFGTEEEKGKVVRAVHRKYPTIKLSDQWKKYL